MMTCFVSVMASHARRIGTFGEVMFHDEDGPILHVSLTICGAGR